MRSSGFVRWSAVGAACVCGLALWTGVAGAGSEEPGDRSPPRRPEGGRGGDRPPRGPFAEKYGDQMRDHPRVVRSLIGLQITREYLDKEAGDLGGRKASAIKACDDAIRELEAVLKVAPKEPRPEGRGPREGGERRGPRGPEGRGPGGPPPMGPDDGFGGPNDDDRDD